MERIRALIDELSRYFAQLSKRERMLVALAGLSVLVFIGSVTMTTISSSIARREVSIEEKSQQLQQVAVYAQNYAQNERTRREAEARLNGPPVRLLSHLQELADKHGLTITSMNDRGENQIDQVKETLVEMQISSTPVNKLTAMLNEIERNPRLLKVKKLRVRRMNADTEDLNVTMTVATYQMAKSG